MIRMTGLNSGLDTDSIVQALMSAQRMKKTKVTSKKTKLEWKKDIWSEMNTKLYDFYKGSLNKIKSQSAYKTKAATSSDTSKVTATATSQAAEGTCKVKVDSLASAQYVTSGKLGTLTDGSKAKETTKLTELADPIAAGTQIAIKSKSGTSLLLVDENTTIGDFTKACTNAGLKASFDETQQRFFISSDDSGVDQTFSITASNLTTDQQDTIANWKKQIGYDNLSSSDKASVQKIFDQLQTGSATIDKVQNSIESYTDKAASNAVNAYYKKQLQDGYEASYFTDDDHTKVSDAGKQALLDSGVKQDDLDKMTEKELADSINSLISKNVAKDLKSDEYQQKITDGIENGIANADDDFLKKDSATRKIDSVAAATTFKDDIGTITNSSSVLAGLGLSSIDGTAVAEGDAGNTSGMVVIAASDASIELNGATLSSSGSTITVNGLTLNILDMTAGSEVSISVTKDVSGIYDTIKDFISEYNSILKEMNTKYNASSAKDYDVLTDEQKEAMSDDEVEKWEDKIKDSLLRRDDTLSSLISSFRDNMSGTITASDGKRYALSSIGISTSADYAEGGLLHIKGDEDDSEYADETNKLEELLNKDPDLVMEVFSGLASNLYDDLFKKMGKTSMSSALTFYNDVEMNSQLSDYKDEIKKWDSKLSTMEERYYSQFTAMEKALASLNSQSNSLSNFFS